MGIVLFNCPTFEIFVPDIFAFIPVHFSSYLGGIVVPLLDSAVCSRKLTGNEEGERGNHK